MIEETLFTGINGRLIFLGMNLTNNLQTYIRKNVKFS